MGPWGMGRYVNSLLLLQLLQVESCRPQRTEPHLPTHAHLLALQKSCSGSHMAHHFSPGREWIT